LRVLAGIYKSRNIDTVNSPNTRPMMSKVRESIFSSLQFSIPDADVLDLYSGSGSLGIEALSRGARFTTFVEKSRDCVKILEKNLKGLENNYKITNLSVDAFITTSINKYSVVFYDPPFNFDTEVVNDEITLIAESIETGGHLIIHRHSSSQAIHLPKFYEIRKEKNYGQSNILIVKKI
jgi:16S rRNA (guanine966-N2)-methyltransferase